MSRRILLQLALVVSVICLTILFVSKPVVTAHHIPHFDKYAHFAVFFFLTLLAELALKWNLWSKLAFVAIYGLFIEVLQHFVPHRSASLGDFIADAAGIICGSIALHLYQRFMQKRNLHKQ